MLQTGILELVLIVSVFVGENKEERIPLLVILLNVPVTFTIYYNYSRILIVPHKLKIKYVPIEPAVFQCQDWTIKRKKKGCTLA